MSDGINKDTYINECKELIEIIKKRAEKEINIMEVCGTHTRSIYNSGIDKILKGYINFLSGPGCPICVTSKGYIDNAIKLISNENIIVTFQDMLGVVGSNSSLKDEKIKGKDIRIIYSPSQVIQIALDNKDKNIIFLAIGFETIAPIIGAVLKECRMKEIKNIFILNGLKTMPNIIRKVLRERNDIQGLICPGHVATIIGEEDFKDISLEYKKPMVISGFEERDILRGILYIVCSVKNNRYGEENLYKKVVKKHGNNRGKEIIKEVFIEGESIWRGFGRVENSGYLLGKEYEKFDVLKRFSLVEKEEKEEKEEGCICSYILRGDMKPVNCNLFKKVCTPYSPKGSCMISEEGLCNVWYFNE